MTGSRFAGLIALGVGVCLMVGDRTVRSGVKIADSDCVDRQCGPCADLTNPAGYCLIPVATFKGCEPADGKMCDWYGDPPHYCSGKNYKGGNCANQTGVEDITTCSVTSSQCNP